MSEIVEAFDRITKEIPMTSQQCFSVKIDF